MIVRVWQVRVKENALAEYEENERNRSLPMFKEQPGCLGVLFLRSMGMCSALTFWSDRAAIEQLNSSKSYLDASRFYENSGMLEGEPTLQVFEVQGGYLGDYLLTMVKG
jgi:heme-degrading monooxygenase HmoA